MTALWHVFRNVFLVGVAVMLVWGPFWRWMDRRLQRRLLREMREGRKGHAEP